MEDLVAESVPLGVVKILDVLEVGGVLRDEGTLLQERGNIGEVGLLGELLDIVEECFLGDTGEGVLDPVTGGELWSALTFLCLILMRMQLMPTYLAVTLRLKLTDWRREPRLSASEPSTLVGC